MVATRVKVPFGQRWSTSMAIVGQSFRLLGRNPDLWAFPGLAAAILGGWLLLLIRFLAPLLGHWLAPAHLTPVYATMVRGLLLVVASYPFSVAASLLNTALSFCVWERLGGRPGTLASGWRRALARAGTVLRFNLIGMLVAGIFQIVGALLGKLRLVPWLGPLTQYVGAAAWGIASFFVIPVLAVEDERSAIQAVKTSAGLARNQWGKALGMVAVGFVITFPIMLLMMVALFWLMFTQAGDRTAFVTWYPLIVVGGVMLSTFLAGTVRVTYQTGLYRFIKTGEEGPYTRASLVDAWQPYRSD